MTSLMGFGQAKCLIWYIGKWSEMSERIIPFDVIESWMMFVKILSMSVADDDVTRVGLQICGMKELEKLASMKSLVGV